MNTYAVVLNEFRGRLSTICGSNGYVRLDGRLSPENALNEALEHFTKRYPSAKHVAVFRAISLGSKGTVIATFPYGREKVYQPIVDDGCYK